MRLHLFVLAGAVLDHPSIDGDFQIGAVLNHASSRVQGAGLDGAALAAGEAIWFAHHDRVHGRNVARVRNRRH